MFQTALFYGTLFKMISLQHVLQQVEHILPALGGGFLL